MGDKFYTLWIVIPTDHDGWEGSTAQSMPSFFVLAYNRDGAEAKARELLKHLPSGTVIHIGEFE